MRSQSGSTGPLVSPRYQCHAIASSMRVKYDVGSYTKKKKERERERKREKKRLWALKQAHMINRSKIPSFFFVTNMTSYIDKCSIKILYILTVENIDLKYYVEKFD